MKVVHPIIISQPAGVGEREVWFDENGVSAELTEAEHARLLTIPGFVCASSFQIAPAVTGQDDGQTLTGDALVGAITRTFDGSLFNPSAADLAEKEEDAEEDDTPEDLVDAWLSMDEAERCDTVASLEEFACGEDYLRFLFDFEAACLNNPKVLAAIDAAIGHLRPPTNPEAINQALVDQSAAGKIATKNPPKKKTTKGS